MQKNEKNEIFEKFQCENFNEIFTPTKFHEILHLYWQLKLKAMPHLHRYWIQRATTRKSASSAINPHSRSDPKMCDPQ